MNKYIEHKFGDIMQVIKFSVTGVDPKTHISTLSEYQWLINNAQQHKDYMLILLEDQAQIVFYNGAKEQQYKEQFNV